MPRRPASQFWYRPAGWTAVWLIAFAVLHAAPTQGAPLEYAVKATYLHKFAPFVEWPSPAAEFPGGASLPGRVLGFVTHDYLEHRSSGDASWATAQNSQALRT